MPIYRRFNKDFFKKWTADMAYILGFLYADGNIVKTKRGTHFVAIYSTDEDLLLSMKKVFNADHKISTRISKTGSVFRIQVGSRVWFNDLCALGLVPDKSSRMRLPYIPKKYVGHFIRGYFDGDGNVWSGSIHNNRITNHIVLQVAFTSASYGFLSDLFVCMQLYGVTGGSLRKSNQGKYSRLSFSTGDALTIHKIMYNGAHKLYLPRKKQVFEKFVNCGGSSTG